VGSIRHACLNEPEKVLYCVCCTKFTPGPLLVMTPEQYQHATSTRTLSRAQTDTESVKPSIVYTVSYSQKFSGWCTNTPQLEALPLFDWMTDDSWEGSRANLMASFDRGTRSNEAHLVLMYLAQ